jgi:ATP-dependent DNA helicase RecG
LLYSKRCSKEGLVRLAVLRESEDGFKIADEDLKLRGGGDLAGTKQSGMPEFRICNLYYHSHLAHKANEIAKQILSKVEYKFEMLDEKYKILIKFYNHYLKDSVDRYC